MGPRGFGKEDQNVPLAVEGRLDWAGLVGDAGFDARGTYCELVHAI